MDGPASCHGHAMDLSANIRCRLVGSDIEIVVHLKPKPEVGGVAEVAREPKGRIGRDGALAAHDLVDPDGSIQKCSGDQKYLNINNLLL
uniref:Uncharacterized protein n=1 Tax=Candidatus Kentrum sp. SD TaxID=2126332 RepID=A0A450YYK3_9GAMM|nr:MAG: hypothetical protein BECKSD772E_GA0070983_10772 [Candidatus Kentron sp. SD]